MSNLDKSESGAYGLEATPEISVVFMGTGDVQNLHQSFIHEDVWAHVDPHIPTVIQPVGANMRYTQTLSINKGVTNTEENYFVVSQYITPDIPDDNSAFFDSQAFILQVRDVSEYHKLAEKIKHATGYKDNAILVVFDDSRGEQRDSHALKLALPTQYLGALSELSTNGFPYRWQETIVNQAEEAQWSYGSSSFSGTSVETDSGFGRGAKVGGGVGFVAGAATGFFVGNIIGAIFGALIGALAGFIGGGAIGEKFFPPKVETPDYQALPQHTPPHGYAGEEDAEAGPHTILTEAALRAHDERMAAQEEQGKLEETPDREMKP